MLEPLKGLKMHWINAQLTNTPSLLISKVQNVNLGGSTWCTRVLKGYGHGDGAGQGPFRPVKCKHHDRYSAKSYSELHTGSGKPYTAQVHKLTLETHYWVRHYSCVLVMVQDGACGYAGYVGSMRAKMYRM